VTVEMLIKNRHDAIKYVCLQRRSGFGLGLSIRKEKLFEIGVIVIMLYN